MKTSPDINKTHVDEGEDAVRKRHDQAKRYKKGTDGRGPKSSGRSWQAHTVSAEQLRTMGFPPVNYIVPGFIPEGLSILAGRPKIGKSWLVLDLCLGVTGDHDVLGGIRPKHGDALYCALEDTNRRLQRRITKLLSPFNSDGWPTRLTLATQWRKLDNGGVKDIAEWCATVPDPKLVVLDTLAGVRPDRLNKDTPYDDDYRALLEVHKLANEHGFAVVALHHTRKMDAEDPLDTISGTLGLVGCADTALVLARTPKGMTLYVRGRDIEESEYAVAFSAETCRWQVLGDAAEIQRSETRSAIIQVLAANLTIPMSPKEIAAAIGIQRNTVDQQLHKMLQNGEVIQVSRGRYAHPDKAQDVCTPISKIRP